ncbi:MAG: tetratricopeptide repeat protein [Halobacteriovoraceae bacterium]|jgi:folate-binding protein YgfZ|nr:tetratricopeptide repeat protein [Halobacteriovoraceae bacterium]
MSIPLENLRTNTHQFNLPLKIIKLSGEDIEQYLHSQTTNNVLKLSSHSFQFNSILDLAGKIIASFVLCKESKEVFYILIAEQFTNSTIERIEKYHIAEEFELEEISEPASLIINDLTTDSGFTGTYFFENDKIVFHASKLNEEIPSELKLLTGVPELGIEVKMGDLINNTFFDELSVDYQKGCYPGQETVSKISTRRGAAYKPVLMIFESNNEIIGKIYKDKVKIGEIYSSCLIDKKRYAYTSLIRDYRIDKSNLNFEIEGGHYQADIHYYPFLKGDKSTLAIDLYDEAVRLFHQEEYEQAVLYFEKALVVKPDFEDAYESLGVLYGRLGEYQKAITLMEKLKEINPKCMMALTNLSLYHMKVGNIEVAEKFKADATFLNFEILGDEANTKRQQEELLQTKIADQKRREEMFLQVIEMDAEDAMANNRMGEIELERKNYEIAEKYFSQALISDQKYSVAYLGHGKSLYQQKKYAEAEEVLNKGISVASKKGDLMPANEMQLLLTKLLLAKD